jgi:uncharacterized membrane protein
MSLQFNGLMSPVVAAAAAVAAAAVVFLLYAREEGRLGPVRRAVLALLRTAVVAAALFLLLRPVLLAEERRERPRPVALLLDDSQSMTQRDQRLSAADRRRVAVAEGRVPPDAPFSPDAEPPEGTSENPSRAELVRAVLGHPKLALLDGLRRAGPLQVYLFGQRVRRLEDPARWAEELRFADARTALAEAVREVLSGAGDPPAAIVIATDGRDNASALGLDEVALECVRSGVPLHIWGVGSSEVGNLAVRDFACPETVFYDDEVAVPVRWRCRGFRQGTAEIELRLGDRVLARREVPLREGEEFREVVPFTPRKDAGLPEKGDLVVTVRARGVSETFTADNELRRPLSIVDRKVRILYVEDAPRWEYKFLQTALLRDRRAEARFVVAQGDRRALESGPPYLPGFPSTRAELFAFDVLILGDVPASFLGNERPAWIRDFVREGGSLIVIAGRRNAPWGWAKTELAEVLPVEFPGARPPFNPAERPTAYVPVLTRQGQRAEMLALADDPDESARLWRELPGFYGFAPGVRLRPGAAALLVHPRAKVGDAPVPVLAVHHYGKGQALFLGTDETWRWRARDEGRLFARFWGQTIYQMGLPHLLGAPKRVQLALERPENVLGRPAYVYARAFDPEFRPYSGERIRARLEFLDAPAGPDRERTLSLEAVPGQPGDYRALLPNDAVGRWALRVDEPAPAALEFRVNLPPQHELEVAGMEEETLRAAAEASGGAFYREEDLHRLAASLRPKSSPVVERRETLLWNAPMLVLFVALIGAEWILRKFSNLS